MICCNLLLRSKDIPNKLFNWLNPIINAAADVKPLITEQTHKTDTQNRHTEQAYRTNTQNRCTEQSHRADIQNKHTEQTHRTDTDRHCKISL